MANSHYAHWNVEGTGFSLSTRPFRSTPNAVGLRMLTVLDEHTRECMCSGPAGR